MATVIKKIESITINGSNKYAGGFIYNISFDPSFAEKPSEITINVISEKGTYTPPKLDLKSPADIKIGSLSLGNFFLYKHRKRHSSQGTILELHFYDPSLVLDKFWVGLISKHGWSNSYQKALEKDYADIRAGKGYNDKLTSVLNTGGGTGAKGDVFAQRENLLLIGRLFHPCDENKDNVIDFKEDGTQMDHCNPCPHCSGDQIESQCLELGATRIFEVGYSFKDLIDNWPKIKFSNGVSISIETPNLSTILSEVYKNFYAEHIGTLREVLSAWCSEFGLSWYYDFTAKQIKFIDLSSKEIEIKENDIISKYKDTQLISYDLEETIENTEQRASIAWYERDGAKKNYNCSKSEPITLAPVFAADYFGNRKRSVDTATGVAQLNSNNDTVSAILSSYYGTLRDAYWWKNIYCIRNPAEAMKMLTTLQDVKPKKSSKGSQEVVINSPYTMSELGDLKILAVVSDSLSEGDKKKTKYQEKANSYYESFKTQLNPAALETFNNYSGFFVIAYYNAEYHEQKIESEREAFDFMGRYFIREHLSRMCGITGNQEFVKNNTQIEAADGSAEIYAKGDGISSHPLTKYNYFPSGCLGCMVGTGNLSTKDPEKNSSYKKGGNVSSQGYTFTKGGNSNGLYNSKTPVSYQKEDGPTFSSNVGNSVPLRLSQTTVLLEREPVWVPTADTFEQWIEPFRETNINLLSPSLLGSDGKGSNNSWILEDLGQTISGIETNVKVFVAYQGDFSVDVTMDEKHPKDLTVYDKPKTEQTIKRIGGKFGYDTKIGLINNTCAKLNFNFWDHKNKKLKDLIPPIFTPPHVMREPKAEGQIVKDKFSLSASTVCDECLGQEGRPPGYKVFVTQTFNQEVIIPKIQTGVASGIKAPDEVMNFDVNYHPITNDDLEAYTGYRGYGCVPNLNYLNEINQNYAKNSYQNKESDKSLSLQIKGLPDLKDISSEMKNGLARIQITVNDQGIASDLLYSTKLMREISPDVINRINQSRSLKIPKGV